MTLEEAIKHTEEVVEGYERKLKVYENIDEDRPLFTEEETECRLCAEEHRQLAEWLKELKKYKEKDTPKLVIYSGDGYADGKMVYDWAECPCCSFTFEKDDANWEIPYCPICGQALKWESEEEEMTNQEMTYAEAKNYLLHCIDEAKSKDWASGIKFALATIEKATESEVEE